MLRSPQLQLHVEAKMTSAAEQTGGILLSNQEEKWNQ